MSRFLRAALGLSVASSSFAFAADSVERVASYSLEIGADGKPLDGYFYLGFVHGLPAQPVELGFNTRQGSTRGSAPFHGQPFPAPTGKIDPYGLHYYSLGWGANSLAQAIEFSRKKSAAGRSPSEERLAALPLALDASGKARSGRPSLNLFDRDTIELLHAYAREHVKTLAAPAPDRVAGDAIIRWGMDNEWEGERGPDYSPEARAAFAGWLDVAYKGRVATLNEAWNTNLASFQAAASGPLPSIDDYKTRPGAFLDWWTFQTENFTAAAAGIARVMHETDPLRRGVSHKSTQQTIEMPVVNRAHTFDHERFADLMRPVSGGLYGIDMYGAGDRQSYELNYIYNCIRPLDGAPGHGVFLPETNNHNGPANAFAATTWQMLANGLKAADFFTLGFAGAQNDWDKFGFIDPATGAPKGKLFYAARWAHAIHRTEAFWSKSIPAPGLPRLALLMPRRDVLLADKSGRTSSRWSYPRNHRWMVYRWLVEQGYWVDVIPYGKLAGENLARYSGLFLIGAEHLTDDENAAVAAYVRSGRILVSDTAPGAFDEHHRARKDTLVPFADADGKDEFALKLEDQSVVAEAASVLKPAAGARIVATTVDGRPAAFSITAGKGRILHFPFELGSLILRKPGAAMPAFLAEGPTADSEEYIVPSGELVIGRWLGQLLRDAGLKPSVDSTPGLGDSGNLRVGQPYVDAVGNTVVVVSTRADSAARPLPSGKITIPLPAGAWTRALWAPAENDGLVEVPARSVGDGRHEIAFPGAQTAGLLYFFKQHEPVLGIPAIDGDSRSIDGFTARVSPGKPFDVTVQLFNTTAAPLAAGKLRLIAPSGWTISPAELPTAALDAGASLDVRFTITPEANSALLKPDWIHPIIARWSDGQRDRAVISANIQVTPDPKRYPLLLSGNASYPPTYPHRLDTGATYRFTTPAAGKVADPAGKSSKVSGPALTNGFDSNIGIRLTGAGSPAWFAVINDVAAEVVFDLKTEREIMSVVINRANRGPSPSKIRLVAGDAVHGYATLAEQTPDADLTEYKFPALSGRGSTLKIQFEWPSTGGTLDEIEIWGR